MTPLMIVHRPGKGEEVQPENVSELGLAERLLAAATDVVQQAEHRPQDDKFVTVPTSTLLWLAKAVVDAQHSRATNNAGHRAE
jgi:hypothetical protein